MTRLGRSVWWAVLVVAATGLLLSLVIVAVSSEEKLRVEEVRGSAAAGAPPTRVQESERSGARRSAGPRTDRVGRSAAVPPQARPRAARPVRLSVPSVALDLSVTSVGVQPNGQMALPPDPREVGWYRFGPAPGSGGGSAVLAGHVDTQEYGVGPLARLGEVGPGDRIDVRLSTGRSTTYRVDSVERFDRQALPESVFGRAGRERLRVVTCTGPYLPEAGGYQQNLVVTAVPV
jgi:hypothetical protein